MAAVDLEGVVAELLADEQPPRHTRGCTNQHVSLGLILCHLRLPHFWCSFRLSASSNVAQYMLRAFVSRDLHSMILRLEMPSYSFSQRVIFCCFPGQGKTITCCSYFHKWVELKKKKIWRSTTRHNNGTRISTRSTMVTGFVGCVRIAVERQTRQPSAVLQVVALRGFRLNQSFLGRE